MAPENHLNAKNINELLLEIGTRMANRGKFAEIAVHGGSSLVFFLEDRKSTRDIDCVLLNGSSEDFFEVAREVAAEHGLSDDWINESVDMFSSANAEYVEHGDFPTDNAGIRVRLAAPEYTLAMKILWMRSSLESNDVKDIWMLLDHCEIKSTREASKILVKYFPDIELSIRNESILEDILMAKSSGQDYDPMIGW